MPEHAKGKPLEVWFQDEARVGQQGTLTRKWARRGTRPRAPRDTRYKWSYIFGAACPARGTAAGLILPYVNAEAMGLHLNEIAKAVAHEAHAMLIVDGAGWYGAKCLQVPDNITLVKLPPYSPELNPMENVWPICGQTNSLSRSSTPTRKSSKNVPKRGTSSPTIQNE